MKAIILTAALFVILLASTSLALTCTSDYQCSSLYGIYCAEENKTSGGLAQCSPVHTLACDSINVSCVSDSDCNGLGPELCEDEIAGICRTNWGDIGTPCQLDIDCGPGNTCSNAICTDRYTDTQCTSDSQCSSSESCFEGFCRAKAIKGGGCYDAFDCYTGAYCYDNVCMDCPIDGGYSGESSTFPSYSNPSGYFCNITGQIECSSDHFWPSYSQVNTLPVGILTLQAQEGDPCASSACCANNAECVNGRCIGIGGGVIANRSSYEMNICSALGYAPSINLYLDGVTPVVATFDYNHEANITNIRKILNDSDSLILSGGPESNPNYPVLLRYHGAAGTEMGVVTYSNSTGNLCYLSQEDTTVLIQCFSSCLGSGQALKEYSGATSYLKHTVRMTNATYPFSCLSDDGKLIIQATPHDGSSVPYDEIHVEVMTGFSSSHVKVLFFETSFNQPGISYLSGGTWYNSDLQGVGAGSWTYNANNNIGRGMYRQAGSYITAYYKSFSGATSLRTYAYDTGTHYSYSTTISAYIPEEAFDSAICCTTDNDCVLLYGDDYACDIDTYSCYLLGGGNKQVNLYLTSSDPHYGTANFCPSYSSSFLISVRDAEMNQLVSTASPATISINVSGGGSVTPSSCITVLGSSCLFVYTSRATAGEDILTISYSGTSTYEPIEGTYHFAITNTCHYLKVKVYDATLAQEILGSLNPLDTTSVLALLDIWLKNVNVNSALGTCYTGTDGVCNLQAITTSLAVTFSKSGYVTLVHNFTTADLDKTILVALYQVGGGLTEPSLPDSSLDTDLPTDVSDVTTGLLSITFAFFARPFVWVVLIITVLIGLILIRWLLVGST